MCDSVPWPARSPARSRLSAEEPGSNSSPFRDGRAFRLVTHQCPAHLLGRHDALVPARFQWAVTEHAAFARELVEIAMPVEVVPSADVVSAFDPERVGVNWV